MPDRKEESKRPRNSQFNESFVLGAYNPIVIQHGKKFAAYDKNGRLIILGYNRRICQEYANDRVQES
mgnify:CR=1 FL=1